jgi:hypothetical protein
MREKMLLASAQAEPTDINFDILGIDKVPKHMQAKIDRFGSCQAWLEPRAVG